MYKGIERLLEQLTKRLEDTTELFTIIVLSSDKSASDFWYF